MKVASEDMRNQNTYETLAQYLLGELSDEMRREIEREYLADGDCLDELLAVEDDLMDEYVRGELSAREREQFEQHLLAGPGQREKLRYAQTLMERMPAVRTTAPAKQGPSSPERDSWFSFYGKRKLVPVLVVGFAAIVLVAGAAWLIMRVIQLQIKVEHMKAEQVTAQQREQELQAKLASEQKEKEELLRQLRQNSEVGMTEGTGEQTTAEKPTAPRMATFMLSPALMRGGEATDFVVPRGVDVVQLQIQVGGADYNSYRAELKTADGESVYDLSGLKARRTHNVELVFLRIPGRLLIKRDYVLKISGLIEGGSFEDAGFYTFRITKK